MEILPFPRRIVLRTLWLINVRWIAIGLLVIAIFFIDNFCLVPLESSKIINTCLFFSVINLLYLIKFKKTKEIDDDQKRVSYYQNFIFTQIIIDYLFLIILLHLSGGIENPFIIFYIFHMVIGSVLLPFKKAIIGTTFVLILVGLLSILEAYGYIHHYPLTGLINDERYLNIRYIIATGFVFVITSYIITFFTDSLASKLKLSEDAYNKANNELKRKDKIKDEYVSRLTHDIKGHLAAIQSSLEVIHSKALGEISEPQFKFIDKAYNRTKKLSHFAQELLHLNKMRLEKLVDLKKVSFKSIIVKLINENKSDAESKNIIINSNLGNIDFIINADLFSLEEAIQNLFNNAIKYSPLKSIINIELSKYQDNKLLFSIKDQGIGIPKDEIPKLFNDFFRASNAKKEGIEGSGIGLSIVKQIINQHNGEILIESEVNKGTKFSIILPFEETVILS